MYMTAMFLAPLKGPSSIFGEIVSSFANLKLDTYVGSSPEIKIGFLVNSGKGCLFTRRDVFRNHACLIQC